MRYICEIFGPAIFEFFNTIGGRAADRDRSCGEPPTEPLVAHGPINLLSRASAARAERRSSSVPPQRNRNELGETTVNKTGQKHPPQQKNQQLRGCSLRSGRRGRR